MRFLKNKILRAQEAQKRKDDQKSSSSSPSSSSLHKPESHEFIKIEDYSAHNVQVLITPLRTIVPLKSKPRQDFSPESGFSAKRGKNSKLNTYGSYATITTKRPAKNIAINYGRAIVSFAISSIAVPYLQPYLAEDNRLSISGFVSFLKKYRTGLKSMQALRTILLIEDQDDDVVIQYKTIFQKLAEIFIKYFSVNWIFHSKVFHKEAHLKFRFKMLRRIRCPELFTYLKHHTKDLKKKTRKISESSFMYDKINSIK